MSILRMMAALAVVLVSAIGAQAAVVSANFSGGSFAMGTGDAGKVPANNWNNIPDNNGGGSSLANLNNNLGVSTSLDLAISNSNVAGGTSPTFADPDDNAMFGGHSWLPGAPIVVTANQIPYSQYDLYVYFRSGQIPFDHTQLFTIDNAANATVLFSQEGKEPASPGGATQSNFFQSTGSTVGADLTFGNYVKFTNVNLPDLRLNLSATQTYTYINGLQFVQTPEPASCVLFGLGAIGMFAVARRRKA